jgi:hypothetical protein
MIKSNVIIHASKVSTAVLALAGVLACSTASWSQPPAGAATTKAAPLAAQPLLETSAAVRTALDTPRKTPRDSVQAILWLIDLGRPELAKPILAELAKLPVTDAQRVAIVEEFGSHGMLHLARASKELGPEAAAFSEACMAAASAAANDPQRIAGLVKQLSNPSSEVRTAARNDLAATGQVGAAAALEALAREADPQCRAMLLQAIELMHPLVDDPLVAMLSTDDPQLRADVARLLQRLAVPQAAPLLANDPAAAERAVKMAIDRHKRGVPPFTVGSDNQVEMWQWDDATKALSGARVPSEEAQIAWISRLADELASKHPASPAAQLHALVLRLEATGLLGGKSNSSPINAAALAKADPQELNAALAMAFESNYSRAARVLAEALGASRDPGMLLTANGKPSPLAAALESPDRRVRFAALAAIMAIDPRTPYPGASRVPDTLAWFAGSTGERQAVVAMPTIARAGDLAGQLAAHQLVAAAANRGREAVDLARTMPDLELVLIDMNILLPEIRQAIYELRISPSTGDVPIALLAADGRLEAAQRLADEHTRVLAFSRPHTPEALATIVDALRRLTARDEVPPAERMAQAEQAQKWLGAIADGSRPFYTFRRAGVRTPVRPYPPTPSVPPNPPVAAPAAEDVPNQ